MHCEHYTHFTRSLNLFLYLFSKIVLVPRKRLRNHAGGQNLSEGKAIYPHLGQTFYPLLFFFVSNLLHRLCPFFSNHLFSNLIIYLIFLRTQHRQMRLRGLEIAIVLNGFLLGKPH